MALEHVALFSLGIAAMLAGLVLLIPRARSRSSFDGAPRVTAA